MDAAARAGIDVDWIWGDDDALRRHVDARLSGTSDDILLHGHHALRTGPALLHARRPFVVSLGGTEAELIEREPRKAEMLDAVFAAARLVLVPHGGASDLPALATLPNDKVRVVPRGLEVPAVTPAVRHPLARGPLRERCGLGADVPLLLVPSGLRPGKDPLRAVRIVDGVRASGVAAHAAILGLPIDATIVHQLADAARSRPYLHLPTPFPADVMDAVYADADVVLNTSRFEGMSNAVLEAQAAGRPVLATAIPANLAGLAPRAAAAAFTDDASAIATAVLWLGSPEVYAEIAREAHAFVKERFGLDAERRALEAAWRDAVS